MKLSLDRASLTSYLERQLVTFFPDGRSAGQALARPVETALERVEHCFSRIKIKYFFDGRESIFNHLHTDHYATFLYFVANSLYRQEGDLSVASKLYALNKALHSLDLYYEVTMPEIFALQHPVGTVIGRGKFSDYLFVYQRCSVGADLANRYPTFGEGVVLFGGAAVIGDCTIGSNAWLSVGATVMNQDVPADSVVFGRSPALVIKPTRRNVVRDMFVRADPVR